MNAQSVLHFHLYIAAGAAAWRDAFDITVDILLVPALLLMAFRALLAWTLLRRGEVRVLTEISIPSSVDGPHPQSFIFSSPLNFSHTGCVWSDERPSLLLWHRLPRSYSGWWLAAQYFLSHRIVSAEQSSDGLYVCLVYHHLHVLLSDLCFSPERRSRCHEL